MAASSTTSRSLFVVESSSSHLLSPVVKSWTPEWWAQACRDALADLKATSWGRVLPWAGLISFTLTLFACLIFYVDSLTGFEHPSLQRTYPPCQPDGSFGVAPPRFNYFHYTGFFQITLSFGYLTFTEAKVIDIVWDLVMGKGGQAILAFYSWKAFSIYVRSAMHAGPVTYSSFFVIFLESEASLASTYRITRDFTTRRALRSKPAMVCIVASMVFVLAWPTLASAMTGYTPAIRPFVLDRDQNLISYPTFISVAYVIHDGWRINLTGDRLVSFSSDNNDGKLVKLVPLLQSGSLIPEDEWPDSCVGTLDHPGCYLLSNVSAYTQAYGFLALDKSGNLNDIETKWMNQTIGRPALNISAFYIPVGSTSLNEYYGRAWIDPRTNQTPYAYRSNETFMTRSGNATYNFAYMEQYGSCQPIENRYEWGVSFLQFFFVMLALMLWAVAVYAMWLKGHLSLEQQHVEEAPTKFKAVIDLAAALNCGLAKVGKTPDRLTNRQFKRCISNRLNGGRVAVRAPPFPGSGYSFRKGGLSWIKRDKWWFTLAFVLSLVPFMAPLILPLALVAPLSFSVILALATGRTRRSRQLMSICGLSLSIVLMGFVGAGLPNSAWEIMKITY